MAKIDYCALKAEYGTPLYIYDFNEISARYTAIKEQFNAHKSLVCYAVKANSNLSILKLLAGLGAGFDCVSIGEVKRALLAGAKPYKIIFSGVGKSEAEIEQALNYGILMINAESAAELASIEKIASQLGKVANISIRINPNIDAKTHPYISTGLSENKFGVSITQARTMYLSAHKSEHLNPVGVHFHIGSQITDISPIIEAANIVSDFTAELIAAGIEIKFFDVGGGLGVRYDDESEVDLYAYAQGILAALKGKDLTILCEPGRYIVANAGELLTSVLYEKRTQNGKRFVIVDAAMNDLIRPSLYSAYHGVCVLKDANKAQKSSADIVGPICESGDFLAKNVSLPELSSGDLLLIKSAGAYGFSMASNYNTRPKAAQIAIQDDKVRQIGARESFEDLVKNEKDFL